LWLVVRCKPKTWQIRKGTPFAIWSNRVWESGRDLSGSGLQQTEG
jgi:hypothetical protein